MSEQMTIYLHNRDEYQRFVKKLEIEHDDVLDASRSDIYTATARLAMRYPTLLRCELAEVRAEQADVDFTPASELDY